MASLDPNVLAAISHVIQQQMQPYTLQFQKLHQQPQVLLEPRQEQFGTPLSRSSSGMMSVTILPAKLFCHGPAVECPPAHQAESTCSSASSSSKCSQRTKSSKKNAPNEYSMRSHRNWTRTAKTPSFQFLTLTFFDTVYLAPKNLRCFTSNLQKKKVWREPQTERQAGHVHKLFKRLVRVPLTKILDEAYESDYDLATRYELAAEKIVKRRRGNHVQSWRPTKINTHLALKYGGVLGIKPSPGLLLCTTIWCQSGTHYRETNREATVVQVSVSTGRRLV